MDSLFALMAILLANIFSKTRQQQKTLNLTGETRKAFLTD